MTPKRYLQNVREQGFPTSGIWKAEAGGRPQGHPMYAFGAFMFRYLASGFAYFI
jgi:hypothetical protein